MAREGIDRQDAISRLRASDRARADYLQRYHGINWLGSMLYDLVINTEHLPVPTAVAIVVRACQTLNERGNNVTPLAGMENKPGGQS